MGEKEAGLAPAREASPGVATAREAGSGMPTGRAVANVDVDGDGMPEPAEGAVVKSKSNITNNREGEGIAIGDPGVNGNLAEPPGGGLPGSAESAIVKSKSNITNNREGGGE